MGIVRCIIAEQKTVRGVELTGDDILKNILIMAPMLDEAGQNKIRGYPYMRKKQLMEEFQVSRAFVDKKVRGIENEVQSGRYNRYTTPDAG